MPFQIQIFRFWFNDPLGDICNSGNTKLYWMFIYNKSIPHCGTIQYVCLEQELGIIF